MLRIALEARLARDVAELRLYGEKLNGTRKREQRGGMELLSLLGSLC
jgi:hypothetical protein